ncbi:MAG TPA: CCA tRNA nucleotidyltransferase [Pirellulales bacterium]|nr:CCA tRNA nucleotidyltransferase [Pirellulales bacterium]
MAPQIDPTAQRRFAIEVVERLRAAGYVAYWAGGCVRDALLGIEPKDYDVATSARPDEIRALFGHRQTLAIGAAFGVITVLGRKKDSTGPIEVATFRQDAAYSDGRHPDAVIFSTPEQDAQRRDFTINGMFFDPRDEKIIDFVGGQEDLLHRREIRAIGDAQQRFAEDKLRMLRAVRFAVRFGFRIESNTRSAIEKMAGQIGVVSIERIVMELRLILLHRDRVAGLELLDELGLFSAILPTLADARDAADSAAWPMTLDVLAALHEPSFPLALAALVHRLLPAREIVKLGTSLKLPTAESQRAARLVAEYQNVLNADTLPWPQLQRLLVADESAELLALTEAIVQATGVGGAALGHCRRKLSLPPEELNPPLLLTGDDLVAHGVRPSPKFQTLLRAVRDAQLEKKISTKAEALALVDKLRRNKPPEGGSS